MGASLKIKVFLLSFVTLLLGSRQAYSQNPTNPNRYWVQTYLGVSDLGSSYNSPGLALEAAAYLNPGFWLVGARVANVNTSSTIQPGEDVFDFQLTAGLSTPSSIPIRFAIVSGVGLSTMTLYDHLDKVKDAFYQGDDKYNTKNYTSVSIPLSFQFQFILSKFVGFGLNLGSSYNSTRPYYAATAGLLIGRLQNSKWGGQQY